MNRGVYRQEMGAITELTAIATDGAMVMRESVRSELYRDDYAALLHDALKRDDAILAASGDGGKGDNEPPANLGGEQSPPELATQWESLWLVLRRMRRPRGFATRADIAAALGVKPHVLRQFANGYVARPAWLPLALVAHVRDAVRGMEPDRASYFLAPLDELLAEVEVRRRGDPEYASQWAEDRASMPPELEGLAL